jgi:hypothetical protein
MMDVRQNVKPGAFGVSEDSVLFEKKVQEVTEAMKEQMSKKGKLGLPELLDQRRLKYGMPDDAFRFQASFDRILLWQIEPHYNEGEFYGNTGIIKPMMAREAGKNEAPRGVIVSAGMKALDNLRSNGIDIGHVVCFIRLAPWRMPIAMVAGKEFPLMILRDGDILGSEDLQTALNQKECEIKLIKHEDGSVEHVYVDNKGQVWDPTMPWIADDF